MTNIQPPIVENQTCQEIDRRKSDMSGNRLSNIRHVHCTSGLNMTHVKWRERQPPMANGDDRTVLIQWHTRMNIRCKGTGWLPIMWGAAPSIYTWLITRNLHQRWCQGAKLRAPKTGTGVNHRCNTSRHNMTHIWPTVMQGIQHTYWQSIDNRPYWWSERWICKSYGMMIEAVAHGNVWQHRHWSNRWCKSNITWMVWKTCTHMNNTTTY